jgi:acyl-CoA thioester hydrolase
MPGKTRFTTELQVRPDDIDMNHHVHASKYFDYVLAARFDQMERCYRMGMPEFRIRGLAWFVRVGHIEHKRPLKLGEWFTVTTWVEEIEADSVRVHFEIAKKTNGKLSATGYNIYTMVAIETGRAQTIPDDIVAKYAI